MVDEHDTSDVFSWNLLLISYSKNCWWCYVIKRLKKDTVVLYSKLKQQYAWMSVKWITLKISDGLFIVLWNKFFIIDLKILWRKEEGNDNNIFFWKIIVMLYF